MKAGQRVITPDGPGVFIAVDLYGMLVVKIPLAHKDAGQGERVSALDVWAYPAKSVSIETQEVIDHGLAG